MVATQQGSVELGVVPVLQQVGSALFQSRSHFNSSVQVSAKDTGESPAEGGPGAGVSPPAIGLPPTVCPQGPRLGSLQEVEGGRFLSSLSLDLQAHPDPLHTMSSFSLEWAARRESPGLQAVTLGKLCNLLGVIV